MNSRSLFYSMVAVSIAWVLVLFWSVFLASEKGPVRGPGGVVMLDAKFCGMVAVGIAWVSVLFLFVLPVSAEGPARGLGGAVTWAANTEMDLEGYRVYFGSSPTTVAQVREVRAPDHALQYGSVGLTPGQWYVSVSAYDFSGNESAKAGPLPFTYDPLPPVVPGNVSIVGVVRTLKDLCLGLGLPESACKIELKLNVALP